MLDQHIKKFFRLVSDDQEGGHFSKVIVLHDSPKMTWEDVSKASPLLPRGWFELARLKKQDRIEFLREFWIQKLPFQIERNDQISNFFAGVEDIGIVLAQKTPLDHFLPHMIYALSENAGFFHGGHPMNENEEIALKNLFQDSILPSDYLAFLEIHNGFSKTTDTGVVSTRVFPEVLKRFTSLIERSAPPLTTKGKTVNPHSLIPFYESFGMPYYQCFLKDWYPEGEMGNVYYSGAAHTISEPKIIEQCGENMSFSTFLDWLFFYLERVA